MTRRIIQSRKIDVVPSDAFFLALEKGEVDPDLYDSAEAGEGGQQDSTLVGGNYLSAEEFLALMAMKLTDKLTFFMSKCEDLMEEYQGEIYRLKDSDQEGGDLMLADLEEIVALLKDQKELIEALTLLETKNDLQANKSIALIHESITILENRWRDILNSQDFFETRKRVDTLFAEQSSNLEDDEDDENDDENSGEDDSGYDEEPLYEDEDEDL